MRALLLVVLAGLCAFAGAFVVQDSHFGIHTAIPHLQGAGVTFNPQGDLFVLDFQHYNNPCLFKFPNAVNQPAFTPIPFNYNPGGCVASGGKLVGGGFTSIISTNTGRLYLTTGQEIDPNTGATIRLAFNSCGAQHGIARDPRDGALFFAKYQNDGATGRTIYRIENPDTHPATQNTCATPFAHTGTDANTGIDGLTVGPDGKVYMAGYDSSSLLVYSAYSTSTPTGTLLGNSFTGNQAGSGPDGISICFGDGVSFAITADANAQTIHRFNLTGPGGAPAYAVSPLVTSTGGYNDWTAVDPKGCIWGSTVNGNGGVWRLSNADGTCMQCSAPQQTSGCDCEKIVNVAKDATSATATSNGDCVGLQFS